MTTFLTKLHTEEKKVTKELKKLGANPYSDWQFLFIVFSCAAIVVVGYSIFVFTQVNKGAFYVAVPKEEVRIDSIDRTMLGNVLDTYRTKKATFEDLTRHPLQFDDPSK